MNLPGESSVADALVGSAASSRGTQSCRAESLGRSLTQRAGACGGL
jgi:hypothetical protein